MAKIGLAHLLYGKWLLLLLIVLGLPTFQDLQEISPLAFLLFITKKL